MLQSYIFTHERPNSFNYITACNLITCFSLLGGVVMTKALLTSASGKKATQNIKSLDDWDHISFTMLSNNSYLYTNSIKSAIHCLWLSTDYSCLAQRLLISKPGIYGRHCLQVQGLFRWLIKKDVMACTKPSAP